MNKLHSFNPLVSLLFSLLTLSTFIQLFDIYTSSPLVITSAVESFPFSSSLHFQVPQLSSLLEITRLTRIFPPESNSPPS